jgi:glutamyl endopeptidase
MMHDKICDAVKERQCPRASVYSFWWGNAMTDLAAAADMHAPITNITLEESPIRERLLSLPVLGQADPVEPTADGTEAVACPVRPESATLMTAPSVVLPDVGAASFPLDVQLETVHGADDRVQVTDTHRYPWSATSSLLITARDGSQWIGTGWFISPRTLVTAGHCVYIPNSPVPARNGWVMGIQVLPGRNGTHLPYGSVTASQFWTVRGWSDKGDENYDYGAIIVPTAVGETVGTLGFGIYGDDDLTDRVVNIAGYPGDKPAGTMWYDARMIASMNSSKVYYDIDTAGGQSGAAVYLIEDGQRIGVAIHTYGGAVTNSGTRISEPVFKNLSDWKV